MNPPPPPGVDPTAWQIYLRDLRSLYAGERLIGAATCFAGLLCGLGSLSTPSTWLRAAAFGLLTVGMVIFAGVILRRTRWAATHRPRPDSPRSPADR